MTLLRWFPNWFPNSTPIITLVSSSPPDSLASSQGMKECALINNPPFFPFREGLASVHSQNPATSRGFFPRGLHRLGRLVHQDGVHAVQRAQGWPGASEAQRKSKRAATSSRAHEIYPVIQFPFSQRGHLGNHSQTNGAIAGCLL